ncbi:MAG: type II toxin-antitoxin system RelE/ParE family toxin [Marinilabiliales bacterium]|nr:MAG: type II toxin-antitoxin system RelE/ParE family toxin [Marinilabiliales bacterium]
MKYKISLLASQDLENIWFYTFENWSAEQADRYLNLILDEIEYVAKKPKSGIDCSSVRKGYYKTKIKSHLIFYKIEKKSNIVEIIRVLHQMMDIENRLND